MFKITYLLTCSLVYPILSRNVLHTTIKNNDYQLVNSQTHKRFASKFPALITKQSNKTLIEWVKLDGMRYQHRMQWYKL